MDDGNNAGLSARKVDYLKYIFDHDGEVRTGDLAAWFRVDPSTISKTVRELVQEGYITNAPYKRIRLSESGREQAKFCIKRHRILSLLFTHYGFSQEQACTEVSRFESYVSRAAIDRICRTMGHPRSAGCGVITHDTGCLGTHEAEQAQQPARIVIRRSRP